MDPSSVILEEFLLEIGIVMCSGHQMKVGRVVTKGLSCGPSDGFGIG